MDLTFSLFPKYLQHLDADGLAEAVVEVGLDTTNVVIRDGYWVTHDNLNHGLTVFMETMRKHGLEVTFATACLQPAQIIADDADVAILADHGIRQFRLSYFTYEGDIHEVLEQARRELAAVADICEKRDIQAVYQLHHGPRMLLSAPSLAYQLVEGLDPRFVGIEPDAGNQQVEGFENWSRCVDLLGPYFCALGVKDTVCWRDEGHDVEPGKGWRRAWAPCHEGMMDWYACFRACRRVGFKGPGVLHPFYHPQDPEQHLAVLKQEVAYLRGVLAAVDGLAEEA